MMHDTYIYMLRTFYRIHRKKLDSIPFYASLFTESLIWLDLAYRLFLTFQWLSFTYFFFVKWFTPEGFRGLLALVGTNGQGIGTSPLSRWFKHVSALNLETCERKNIDEYILKLYDDIDEGIFTLNNEKKKTFHGYFTNNSLFVFHFA